MMLYFAFPGMQNKKEKEEERKEEEKKEEEEEEAESLFLYTLNQIKSDFHLCCYIENMFRQSHSELLFLPFSFAYTPLNQILRRAFERCLFCLPYACFDR